MLDAAMAGFRPACDGADFIARFAEADADRARAADVLVVPVFLAHLLDADARLAEPLVSAARDGHPVKVEMVAQALNYCHLPERARWMRALAGEGAAAAMDGGGASFLDLRPSHPVHVDMLRVSFLATGLAAYLDLLADLLDGWQPPARVAALVTAAGDDARAQAPAMAAVLAQAAETALVALAGDAAVAPCLHRRAARADGVAAAVAARLLARAQAGLSAPV